MSVFKKFVLRTIACLCSVSLFAQKGKSAKANDVHTLIVFFDGLRPDYITAEGMPRLYAFKQMACYGTQQHSVFPAVTRVNSSSYTLPTSNVDLVSTVLHIAGIAVPPTMDGRIMRELLQQEKTFSQKPLTKTIETEAGSYKLILHQTTVDNHRYVDFAKVTRN